MHHSSVSSERAFSIVVVWTDQMSDHSCLDNFNCVFVGSIYTISIAYLYRFNGVEMHSLFQVVNRHNNVKLAIVNMVVLYIPCDWQCWVGNHEQCCAAPCEQCCAASCEQWCWKNNAEQHWWSNNVVQLWYSRCYISVQPISILNNVVETMMNNIDRLTMLFSHDSHWVINSNVLSNISNTRKSVSYYI